MDLALLGFIAAVVVTALSGAFFRPGAWYERLDKPDWRPPNWLFGPVWMVLYGMIAFSGWLVWRKVGFEGWAMPIYAVQLALNFGWSWLMFGLRRIDWALAEIGALWLSIVATIAVFHPIDAGAAWLLVPYLLWASFAGVLNFAIWRRNGGRAAATL